jgi:hypothetical protein
MVQMFGQGDQLHPEDDDSWQYKLIPSSEGKVFQMDANNMQQTAETDANKSILHFSHV